MQRPNPRGAPRHTVFVDDTGHRARRSQLAYRAFVLLGVGALTLFAVSVLGGVPLPGLSRPVPLPSNEPAHPRGEAASPGSDFGGRPGATAPQPGTNPASGPGIVPPSATTHAAPTARTSASVVAARPSSSAAPPATSTHPGNAPSRTTGVTPTRTTGTTPTRTTGATPTRTTGATPTRTTGSTPTPTSSASPSTGRRTTPPAAHPHPTNTHTLR